MVHSLDGDNDFDIVAGVLQRHTLIPYLLISAKITNFKRR